MEHIGPSRRISPHRRAATHGGIPASAAERTMTDSTSARVASRRAVAWNPQDRNLPIGYLRAFVTAMVLAHHAVLAYCSFAPPQARFAASPGLWQAYPIVDARRWKGFDPFVGYNDMFFMALMFFLSGLFVWGSLRRKGASVFMHGRLMRLGLPFVAAAAVIAPLTYYPTYLAAGFANPNPAGFFRWWLATGNWLAGPAWFIWVLLAFGCVAAGLFKAFPHWAERTQGRFPSVFRRPSAFFGALAAASIVSYLPMALAAGPSGWTSCGPFAFQTSRLPLYATWFFAGICAGACSGRDSVLAPGGALARTWLGWLGWSASCFGVLTIVTHPAIRSAHSIGWDAIEAVAWAVSCTAASLLALALFLRFANKRVMALDSLADNAYGIYLIHYAFVTWFQYALLRAPLPGAVKGCLATLGALGLSWAAVGALRRFSAIRRIV